MVRTFFWFTYFWLYQFISLFFLCKYYFLYFTKQVNKKENYLHEVVSLWARRMFWAAGAKVEVEGLENIPKNENVLFVSNHQGNFDIPLFLGFIPNKKGFVAKIELKKLPIVYNWMKKLHCVFLDRNNPRQSIQAIGEAIEILKKGYSMVIFPEGTRSKQSSMGEFKKGSLKLALKANVNIVPVTINGTYTLLESNNYKIVPNNINVYVHPMIQVESLSQEEKNNLSLLVQQKIQEKLLLK